MLVSVPLHIAGFRATLLPFHTVECRLVALSIFADIAEISKLGGLLVVLRDKLVKCALAHLQPRTVRLQLAKQLELRIVQIPHSNNTPVRREKELVVF
jgi:hypothetical protein